jgi:hypothetical protein
MSSLSSSSATSALEEEVAEYKKKISESKKRISSLELEVDGYVAQLKEAMDQGRRSELGQIMNASRNSDLVASRNDLLASRNLLNTLLQQQHTRLSKHPRTLPTTTLLFPLCAPSYFLLLNIPISSCLSPYSY